MYDWCQAGPCSSINNRQHRILRLESSPVIPAPRDHQIMEIETDIRKCLGSYLINELTRVNISLHCFLISNILLNPNLPPGSWRYEWSSKSTVWVYKAFINKSDEGVITHVGCINCIMRCSVIHFIRPGNWLLGKHLEEFTPRPGWVGSARASLALVSESH